MVFTGVRLSWVAFRLGAMINYEFSNLPHNGVTPSNPIKKNHQDCFLSFFFPVNIYFSGIFSPFLCCSQKKEYVAFFFPPLQRRKTSLRLALAAFPSDGGIPCVRGDSGPLPMALGPLVGHPQPPRQRHPAHPVTLGWQGRRGDWRCGAWGGGSQHVPKGRKG